jgi:hypothetical protein
MSLQFPVSDWPKLQISKMNTFKWFRSYGILMIDVAAEFCTWTEQQQNKSSIPSLELAETPEVPNTFSVDNSLTFLMVH